MTFYLTREAEQDVISIYLYSAETFGPVQAEAYHEKLAATFRRLAEQPRIARLRTEIDPPVRVHACGAHIIIYGIQPDDSVLIVRVRHGSEDWMADDQLEDEQL